MKNGSKVVMEKINSVLASVSYPGIDFHVAGTGSDIFMQIKCDGICNVTGEPMKWSGRKWRLSRFMTKSEIVQTAFKAVLTALEHEAREAFTYHGASIFDPHYNVDALLALRKSARALEVRHDISVP